MRGMDVNMQVQAHKGGGAQSMAKPKSREANIDIKYRSKQANIDMHKGNDPNSLI